jgi:hypothetical protein
MRMYNFDFFEYICGLISSHIYLFLYLPVLLFLAKLVELDHESGIKLYFLLVNITCRATSVAVISWNLIKGQRIKTGKLMSIRALSTILHTKDQAVRMLEFPRFQQNSTRKWVKFPCTVPSSRSLMGLARPLLNRESGPFRLLGFAMIRKRWAGAKCDVKSGQTSVNLISVPALWLC